MSPSSRAAWKAASTSSSERGFTYKLAARIDPPKPSSTRSGAVARRPVLLAPATALVAEVDGGGGERSLIV